jgi:hypothetical protein
MERRWRSQAPVGSGVEGRQVSGRGRSGAGSVRRLRASAARSWAGVRTPSRNGVADRSLSDRGIARAQCSGVQCHRVVASADRERVCCDRLHHYGS